MVVRVLELSKARELYDYSTFLEGFSREEIEDFWKESFSLSKELEIDLPDDDFENGIPSITCKAHVFPNEDTLKKYKKEREDSFFFTFCT